MSKELICRLIKPHLTDNPEGCFENGEFDLDVDIDSPNKLALWINGDTKVSIPLEVNLDNARLVEAVVNDLGFRVIHTWGLQYRSNI